MNDIFLKIAMKTLIKNKKRAIATIVGIVISVALITAVLSITKILRDSIIELDAETEQWTLILDYSFLHGENTSIGQNDVYKNGEKENKFLPEYKDGLFVFDEQIKANYVDVEPYYIDVNYVFFDGNSMEFLNPKIISGSMPADEDEVAISFRLYERIDKEVGSKIEIFDKNENNFKEVTISGIFAKGNISDSIVSQECIVSNDITLFDGARTYGLFNINGSLEKEENKRLIDEVTAIYNGIQDVYLLKTNKVYDLTKLMMISLIVLAFVISGGFILIYNTFSISLRERRKAYSVMESLGATPRQKRKIPMYESIIFGTISIPIGIFFGSILTKLSLKIAGEKLITLILPNYDNLANITMPTSMLITSGALSIILIFFASIFPAIRHEDNFNISYARDSDKHARTRDFSVINKLASKLGLNFHMAYVHFFNNKSYFRPTSISIIMAVTLLVTGTGVIKYAQTTETEVLSRAERYNVSISNESADNVGSINDIFEDLKDNKDIAKSPTNRIFYKKVKLPLYIGIDRIDYDMYILDDDSYRRYINHLENTNLIKKIDKNSNTNIVGLDYITDYDPSTNKVEKVHVFDGEKNSLSLSLDMDGNRNIVIDSYTKEIPKGLSSYLDQKSIVTSESFAKEHIYYHRDQISKEEILIESKNPVKAIDEINKYIKDENINIDRVENLEVLKEEINGIMLVVTVFAYAFSFLIGIIAAANAFNAISSNIETRRLELISLTLIGLEEKRLYKMIIMENMMLVLRSLFQGLILSLVLLYIPYSAVSTAGITGYIVPLGSIVVSLMGGIIAMAVISVYVCSRLKTRVLDNLSVVVGEENI